MVDNITKKDIEQRLRIFIHEDILEGQGGDLKNDDPLFELGVIDSFTLASLISFISKEFDIEISHKEILPKHFKDVTSIAGFIKSAICTR